jgi:hypothetical protein
MAPAHFVLGVIQRQEDWQSIANPGDLRPASETRRVTASGAAECLRISVELGMNWVERLLGADSVEEPSHYSASRYIC